MAKRPTLKDLAQTAGVGLATVDRVLNGRKNVHRSMIQRVLEAAEKIGYPTHRLVERQNEASRRLVRFGFVLHKPSQEFYQRFARELTSAVDARQDIRGMCTVRFSSSQSPDDFAAALKETAKSSDVIATSAINHPILTEIVKELQGAGKPVFALLNDMAYGAQQGYVGLDNVKVGRIAAWLITTQVRDLGKLGIFVGGNRWHGHILRETGFRSYLRENAPQFEMLDAVVNLETRQVTYEATLELLNRHSELRGIYVAGGGMEGAITAVREMRPPGKIALVVNELIEESRKALADRYVAMVIATPLRELSTQLIAMMIEAATSGPNAAHGQHFLTPQIYVPESI